MRHHSVPCPRCGSAVDVGPFDYFPPRRNEPQVACPRCGTGQFLALRTRLLGALIIFLVLASGAVCLGLARKNGLVFHLGTIPDRYVYNSLIAFNVLLAFLCWPPIVRRYGIWKVWTADSKYHVH